MVYTFASIDISLKTHDFGKNLATIYLSRRLTDDIVDQSFSNRLNCYIKIAEE